MAARERAPNLSRLVEAMTADEVDTLRDLIGIDIVNWSVNETGVSDFERQVANHRKLVAESPKPKLGPAQLREWEQGMKCVSCSTVGGAADLYITLKDSTTVCIECLEYLLQQVRLGKR